MTNPTRHVVIIGASFAGLFAAAAVAASAATAPAVAAGNCTGTDDGTDNGNGTGNGDSVKVTLLERDRLSDLAEPRPGVPQGVQPHVLLYRGLLTAENLLPGIEREVLDAGGLRIDTGRIPWLGRYGWSPLDLPSYDILSVSRPLLELLVRRRVSGLTGINLRDGVRVSGLEQTPVGWNVRCASGESLTADVVVDASGRNSRLPTWLAELGYPVTEPETVEAKLGYASRRYRAPEPPPLDAGLVIAATPESPLGCTILPIEGQQWLVLVAGYGERRPSRDTSHFAGALAYLRDRAAADLVSRLQPIGEAAVYRQTGNRRHVYARASRWPRGLLVTGDALCAFNPIYGQGITVAAVQAELLGSGIGGVQDARSTRRLQRRLASVTNLPWSVATSEDLRQPTSSGRLTAAQRLLTRWTDRMSQLAVAGDPACTAAFTQVYHLVGAPTLLFSPRVVAAVLASYVRGVPPPLPRPAVLDGLAGGRATSPGAAWQ